MLSLTLEIERRNVLNPSKKWTVRERSTLINDLQTEIMNLVCEKLPNAGPNITLRMQIIDRLEDCGRRIGFLNKLSSAFLEANRKDVLNGQAPSISD
jgi:hypothetical protein